MPHSSNSSNNSHRIVVLDFGSQYSQLIARRIRSLGVHADLLAHDCAPSQWKNACGIILSGGPDSVYGQTAAGISTDIFSGNMPVLGICYGMQIMSSTLGGKVERAKKREYGPATLQRTQNSILFQGLPKEFGVWMSHGDNVTSLPPGFLRSAFTANSSEAAIEHPRKNLFGLQFHPEVEHTQYGKEILKNFALAICGCKPSNANIEQFIEGKIKEIRKTVGKERALCAVSGGVDSSVAAALVGKAIGDQLTCVFVDPGLMRKDEPKQILDILQNQLGLQVKQVPAQNQFLKALKGKTYGETKRKAIGREFIRVFEKEAKILKPKPTWLVQGTIHSDVVESAKTTTGKTTKTIKSHHNVGGLPKKLNLAVLEPLRDLFKDEVRSVGQTLGLPESAVWRQPFPGPGLAIRIAGEVTKAKLEILKNADAIVREEIENAGLARSFYQYFAILLSEKTVAVRGDQRYYAYPIVVKAVVSSDIMTSDWGRLPYDLLARISWRITNEVDGAARVLYDVTSKPPGTTEWE